MKKITRRQAGVTALGSMLAAGGKAVAQTPPGPLAHGDLLQAARDSKRLAADSLAKFELPMSVEPAFQFRA